MLRNRNQTKKKKKHLQLQIADQYFVWMRVAGRGGVRANGRIYKRAQGDSWSEEYAHYLDCGDGFMMHTYVNIYQIVYFKYV